MSVPLYLAPMATLTHRGFRELLQSFGGCDLYYSEMIGAAPFLFGGRFEESYADPLPCPQKLIYQLVGNDAEQLSQCAEVLNERGPFGVDLNMGCSAPEIQRAGSGVAWMRDTEAAARLIAAVRPKVAGRLSVKLRLGFSEDYEKLLTFCRALVNEGVQHITLHPRLAGDKFKGRARWEYVYRLRNDLSVPVSGNGDIQTVTDALSRIAGAAQSEAGASKASVSAFGASPQIDALMLGRAAIRQPWIFRDIKAALNNEEIPARPDIMETGLRFLELLRRYVPTEFHPTRSRRFFFYYCENLKWSHHLKTELNRQCDTRGMEAVWREHFRQNGEEA